MKIVLYVLAFVSLIIIILENNGIYPKYRKCGYDTNSCYSQLPYGSKIIEIEREYVIFQLDNKQYVAKKSFHKGGFSLIYNLHVGE